MIQSNFVLLYIMIFRNVTPVLKQEHDVWGMSLITETMVTSKNRVLLYNDVNDWEDRNATGWQTASNHMWTQLNLTKKNQCEFFIMLY